MDLIDIVFIVVGIPLFIYVCLVALIMVMAAGMAKMQLRRVSVEHENASYRKAERVGADDAWMEGRGYQRAGVFESGLGSIRTSIVVWQQPHAARFICVYFIQDKMTIDIVTQFHPNDADLTTGSSADGKLFPRPEDMWVQQFVDYPLDELYSHHEQAEKALINQRRYHVIDQSPAFEDLFLEAIHGAIAYTKTYFLWQLRAPWWYFMRKRRGRLSVIDQLERGLTGPWK